jgi:cytochrome oxidase Cu insertion factor (SCO1/SenC/PrrC family)
MQNEIDDSQHLARQRKGRWVVLSMLIFFVAPIIAVIAMYKLDWRPQGASVGELITPAYLLQTPKTLKLSDGKVVNKEFWADKWSMVYVADVCAVSCKAKLRNMRQIHVSLYKEIPRMQRVLITEQADVADLKQIHPELQILNGDAGALSELHEQFSQKGAPAYKADQLYLVDPRGFLMMRYAANADPALIRKDIVRLMKYSWAG